MPRPPSPTGWRATARRSGAFRKLALLDPEEVTVPDLGQCPLGGEWSPQVRAYWETLWQLPTAAEWAPADVEELRSGLIVLKERMARLPGAGLAPDTEARLAVSLASEARLQAGRFMLSPLDRQRGRISLVAKGEEARPRSEPIASLPAVKDGSEPMSDEWLAARGLES